MSEYPHIDTIYKRDDRGRLRLGEFSRDEFAYLADNQWIGTEKVDGTNIRVIFDASASTAIRFGGKTDNAQMPTFLYDKLTAIFQTGDMVERLGKQFDESAILYGEGYGARIQKGGGNYNPAGVDFVLFDVKVGDWWLKREDVEEVAWNLGLRVVPILLKGTLSEAVTFVRHGFDSSWGDFRAEGLVLLPAVPLHARGGHRIITKIKHRDFSNLIEAGR